MRDDLGTWTKSAKSRDPERPPHFSKITETEYFEAKDSSGVTVAVYDWDGCRAPVILTKKGPPPRVDEPAPDGPGPTAGQRRAEVLARLRRGGWVDGPELATEECGGSEGLRRLRELRAEGHDIVKRHHRGEGRTSYEYMLVEKKP